MPDIFEVILLHNKERMLKFFTLIKIVMQVFWKNGKSQQKTI